jgi:hypothetical protein
MTSVENRPVDLECRLNIGWCSGSALHDGASVAIAGP